MSNTNYFHRLRIRLLWVLVPFFAMFGSAAAQLSDSVGAQPEAKASAKRYDISSMLILLLNGDSDSITPLLNTPPVMGDIPNQNGSVGIALTPLNLASFVTVTNGDPITGYAMASGHLPPGVSLNASTGSIGGTPTTVGTYNIAVTASDQDGTSNAVTIAFAISGAVAATPPVMGDVPNQSGTVGTPIVALNLASYVTATNGDVITAYAMAGGSLPPGISLNTKTGSIGGTPTAAGTYNLTVTALDKDGASNADAVQFVIKAGANTAQPPIMGNIPEQEGTLNTPIAKISLADYVTRTNGDSVTAYSIASGDLPPGLIFNSSSGVISGTPSSGGSYNIAVTASDKDGASNTAVLWFEILDPALQIAPDMRGLPVSMTYDERMAAIDKVFAYIKNSWTSQNLGSDKTTLVKYIASQPEFADAGISPDGSVWTRFKDGRPASFPFVDSSASPLINAIVSPPVAPLLSSRALTEATYASQPVGVMPTSKTAMLLNIDNLGRTFPDTVAPWLTKAGYEVVRPVGTIVDLMDKVKDVGVLHIATHGTYIVRLSGVQEYVLSSADHVIARNQLDTARQQFLDKMLQGGYIFVSAQTTKDSRIQTQYWSFGEKFVRDFWSFSENSLIAIDACKMYEDPRSSASFRNALAGKSWNKTALLGWNASATADGSAQIMTLFFDLLLARNETPPSQIRPRGHKTSLLPITEWIVLGNWSTLTIRVAQPNCLAKPSVLNRPIPDCCRIFSLPASFHPATVQ